MISIELVCCPERNTLLTVVEISAIARRSWRILARSVVGQGAQVTHRLIQGNDITIALLDIHQVGLVRRQGTIPHGFPDNCWTKAALHRINRRCPDATTGDAAGYQQTVNAQNLELCSEAGAKKCRTLFLADHQVTRFRIQPVINISPFGTFDQDPNAWRLLSEEIGGEIRRIVLDRGKYHRNTL